MKILAAAALMALAGGCAGDPAKPRHVAVPNVPSTMVPVNGNVIERWPNGTVRSEREYREGRIHQAVYYASDGSVVYEMSEDESRVSDAGH